MRRNRAWVGLTVGLLATILVGGVAAADDDPLTGTWHQRDNGQSNIFYFIDEPVGGVYPVVYYDDATGIDVCGDRGPMLWSGFLTETTENVYEGSFGNYWCPDDGDGVVAQHPFDAIPSPFLFEGDAALTYHPETGMISGGIGQCTGTLQDGIDNPNEAAEEIAEGKYPPPDSTPGCNE